MTCYFQASSENAMFCIGPKICLSNISHLDKATESHGYWKQTHNIAKSMID